MDKLKKSTATISIDGVKLENTTQLSKTATNHLPSRPPITRVLQNFHLVWLHANIDEEKNEDFRKAINRLQQVVYIVNTFVDADECIDFITDKKEVQMLLVVSEGFTKLVVPIAQEIPQITSIYILSLNKTSCEKLANKYHKVEGTFIDIISICQTLKHAVRNLDPNSVSISFVKKNDESAKQNLDSLDKSFMYTQILKEILLTIDFEQKHINDFLAYCRQLSIGNVIELRHIDRIETEYHDHEPIWWYTYDSFLYSMLNRALRLMEVDIIIKIGFFLKDLHNNIVKLRSQQFNEHHHSKPFTVYRGQGLSERDFHELQQTQGGLLSFNNFLSTSLDRAVSFAFADSIRSNPDMIGILFHITIDSSIHSSKFANVKDVSYYKAEDEILFSMHSIFRIGQIKEIDGNARLWQVELTLTSDNDPQLAELTEHIRKETFPNEKGWYRLGHLLIKLGEIDKAEQVCNVLLHRTTKETDKGNIYHMLGMIRYHQGEYQDALRYFEKALEIYQKPLPDNHPDLAASYSNIGVVYDHMGEYSKALQYHEKALEIYRKTLPDNHPSWTTSYNNIGLVYDHMGEYSKALQYYEKALEIRQKTLSNNHPDLATSYSNIAGVYDDMGEYSKALQYHEKALEIYRKTLPDNHPSWTTSCNNIGLVYDHMGEYSKALQYYDKALEIRHKTLPDNHPDLATSYNNIGVVYDHMGEYSKALQYHKKALEIIQKTLPDNHPDLASSYNNIGAVYDHMGEYSRALQYYEEALEIRQKALPDNHPDLATSYNDTGLVYSHMGEYTKALQYYEEALEIYQKTLPDNHPDLASSYNNTGLVYSHMGEYSEALQYYGKALEIRQKALPDNHPDLATSYNNIGVVYDNIGEYSKALQYYEEALEIRQKALPDNHPSLATSYNNIGLVYDNMEEYSEALQYHEKALEICQKTLPDNHPDLASFYNNIGLVYSHMRDYSKALQYYGKALEIRQKALSDNHPDLATSYNDTGLVYSHMGEYSEALQHYERSLDIFQRSLPINHPHIKNVKKSIGVIKRKL